PPLHFPVDFRAQCSQKGFIDLLSGIWCRGKGQDLLLNFRSQVKKVHDLRHASAGHVSEASEISVVANFATIDQVLKLDGESHQPRDSRDVRWIGHLGPAYDVTLAALRRGNGDFDLKRLLVTLHRTASL